MIQQKIKRWHSIAAAAVLILGIVLVLCICHSRQSSAGQTTLPSAEEPFNAYSGWQFQQENGTVTCLTQPVMQGIDVSSHQGQIDWQQVKQSGVEFVFIRVGYRGTTEGGVYPDDMAESYYAGAKQAGLKVGAYFFSQATNPQEASKEAWFTVMALAGWKLDMPVVFDWERVDDTARTSNTDGATVMACAEEFCRIVEKSGFTPMLYFNTSLGKDELELDRFPETGLWLAQYTDAPDFPRQIDFWQYSCTASVPGITGTVDRNLYFCSGE